MMTGHTRDALGGVAVGLLLLAAVVANASAQTLYLKGQNVQPVFEGWERNPDGTFSMVFGYLNRNYAEEPHILVGPDNAFAPGPADRGQPAHFYPRRQSFVFRVTVPADWGKQELVWTVSHNGRPASAVASLLPVWEIDEGVWRANRNRRGGISGRVFEPNARPSVKVVGDEIVTVTLSDTLTLTVSASDDGKPGPRPLRSSPSPPAEKAPTITAGVPGIGVGLDPNSQDMVKAAAARSTGLAVSWLHYRGPGAVTFEPMLIPIKPDGKALAGTAATSLRFSEPGTYVIRAVADDGVFTTPTDVTVVVKSATSEVQR